METAVRMGPSNAEAPKIARAKSFVPEPEYRRMDEVAGQELLLSGTYEDQDQFGPFLLITVAAQATPERAFLVKVQSRLVEELRGVQQAVDREDAHYPLAVRFRKRPLSDGRSTWIME